MNIEDYEFHLQFLNFIYPPKLLQHQKITKIQKFYRLLLPQKINQGWKKKNQLNYTIKSQGM